MKIVESEGSSIVLSKLATASGSAVSKRFTIKIFFSDSIGERELSIIIFRASETLNPLPSGSIIDKSG